MRRTLNGMLGLAAAGAALLTLSAAEAAVRKCGPAITSDVSRADNEFLGKRKALTSWTMKATKLGGPAFASWRIADKKVLGCKPGKTPSDGVECVAYASPCTIVQNGAPGPQTPPAKPRGKRRIGGNTPFDI